MGYHAPVDRHTLMYMWSALVGVRGPSIITTIKKRARNRERSRLVDIERELVGGDRLVFEMKNTWYTHINFSKK